MNIRKLENAAKTLDAIKAIDAEIIALDKLAQQCASGPKGIEISIAVEGHKEEEAKKVSFDADGSLAIGDKPYSGGLYLARYAGLLTEWGGTSDLKKEADIAPSFNVDDVTAIRVIATMIEGSNEKREKLLAKLRSMGFAI